MIAAMRKNVCSIEGIKIRLLWKYTSRKVCVLCVCVCVISTMAIKLICLWRRWCMCRLAVGEEGKKTKLLLGFQYCRKMYIWNLLKYSENLTKLFCRVNYVISWNIKICSGSHYVGIQKGYCGPQTSHPDQCLSFALRKTSVTRNAVTL